MSRLFHDSSFAIRSLARRPGWTAAAVATLAIGIGSNTALFSLVHTMLWKPYPYGRSHQLVRVLATIPERGFFASNLSFPDYLAYREQAPKEIITDIALSDWEPFNLSGGDEAIRVGGGLVTYNLFDVLEVEPILGRHFLPEEDRPGGEAVMMIDESLWRSYFGGDSDIVGRRVLVNGSPRSVVGVVPSASAYPDLAKMWVPLALDDERSPRGVNWLQATARLAENVSIDEAQAALEPLAAVLAQEYPETNQGRGVRVISLREERTEEFRELSLTLLGVVAFVLLIVCANVANLLLARGVAREQEMVIRKALGASRAQLVSQLLTESLILGGLGAGLGLFIGFLGAERIPLLVDTEIPSWVSLDLDAAILGYTLLVSLVAVLCFGIAPALQTARNPSQASTSRSFGRGRFRAALVVSEVAMSLVLLVGAGLMVQSLLRVVELDPGFEPEGRLTLGLDLLAHARESREQRLVWFDRFRERFEAIPGVLSVGIVDRIPFKDRTNSINYFVEGQDPDDLHQNPTALVVRVSPGYFDALGIPIRRGRSFDRDRAPDAPPVAVVSSQFAEHFWPGESAIGRRFKFRDTDAPWTEIRAVVSDVRQWPTREPALTIYLPYTDAPSTRMTWVLRTGGDPMSLVGPVREAVREVDPNQPLHEVMSMRELMSLSVWPWRFFARLFWIFAAVALALAAVGIYGVMSYSVSQRRREVGLRMALGADRARVVRMVLEDGGTMVVTGLLIGCRLALGLGKILSGVVYGISWFEAPTLVLVGGLLVTVALLAVLLPAHRASRVDPMVALRYE